MGGRTRRRNGEKERFWRQVVGEHSSSGLTVRQYCENRGVSEPSFFAWRRELAQRDTAANKQAKPSRRPVSARVMSQRPAPPRFAQLQIAPGELASGACIEIALPAGIRIRVPRGVCQDTLSTVLGTLERRPC
jgi:transposase-like protein